MSYVAVAIGGSALLGAATSSSDRKAAKSAQKAQIEQNRIGRQFTEEQLGLSLGGMEQAYPLANQARNTGYNLGIDMSDQGYRGATDMTNAGMQQYQNAIMGLPVDYSQLQAPAFNYTDLNTAFNQEAQAPTRQAGELDNRIIPGQTSNSDLIRMYGGDDQEWIDSQTVDYRDNAYDWSQFKSADEALASLDPSGLTPENYRKFSNLYRNMFLPQGSQDGTWAQLGKSLAAR